MRKPFFNLFTVAAGAVLVAALGVTAHAQGVHLFGAPSSAIHAESSPSADPTESPEPAESPEASASPEPSRSPEPAESPGPTASPQQRTPASTPSSQPTPKPSPQEVTAAGTIYPYVAYAGAPKKKKGGKGG